MPPESLIDISLSEMHHSGYEGLDNLLDIVRSFVFPDDDVPLIYLRALDRLTPYFGNDKHIDKRQRDRVKALPAQINSQPRKVGLNVPVYGPRRRIGMFSLVDDPRENNPEFPRLAQGFLQPVHQRYCEMWSAPEDATRLLYSFTPRELDVMRLVVRGRSNVDIAQKTSLSKHTVDSYLRRVYIKLGVNDRVSAALKSIELGLLNVAVE